MPNNQKETSRFMKLLRKWSRILHRDIGFFFIGATIVYGFSGIALNHNRDWNPNYTVSIDNFKADKVFPAKSTKEDIVKWLGEQNFDGEYKTHYYTTANEVKIYLTNSITIEMDLGSGIGTVETLKRRPIFYHTNFLHYNPNKWWTMFSDAFAVSLIIFALTSLFMVRGKKGAWGRGGIYMAVGILIPLLILFLT